MISFYYQTYLSADGAEVCAPNGRARDRQGRGGHRFGDRGAAARAAAIRADLDALAATVEFHARRRPFCADVYHVSVLVNSLCADRPVQTSAGYPVGGVALEILAACVGWEAFIHFFLWYYAMSKYVIIFDMVYSIHYTFIYLSLVSYLSINIYIYIYIYTLCVCTYIYIYINK